MAVCPEIGHDLELSHNDPNRMRQAMNAPWKSKSDGGPFVEEVEVRGHIIDSLILPKILDSISGSGGNFRIKEITIGQARNDPSYALLEVRADDGQVLERILAQIADHGAVPTTDATIAAWPRPTSPAPFPRISTARPTSGPRSALAGHWCRSPIRRWIAASLVDAPRHRPLPADERSPPGRPDRRGPRRSAGLSRRAFARAADLRVHGQQRVHREAQEAWPSARSPGELADTAPRAAERCSSAGRPSSTPAAASFSQQMIRVGYVNVLFAGNALATHDIEQALFGTSLGVYLDRGDPGRGRATPITSGPSTAFAGGRHPAGGRERRAHLGSHVRVRSPRGRLPPGRQHPRRRPAARRHYRRAGRPAADAGEVRGVTFCLMIATTLHSIAVGNLLPAWVNVVCVDINPSTAIKLADRGSFQTVGLVTDVAPFLRALVDELGRTGERQEREKGDEETR